MDLVDGDFDSDRQHAESNNNISVHRDLDVRALENYI